jgi:hypothetical protein
MFRYYITITIVLSFINLNAQNKDAPGWTPGFDEAYKCLYRHEESICSKSEDELRRKNKKKRKELIDKAYGYYGWTSNDDFDDTVTHGVTFLECGPWRFQITKESGDYPLLKVNRIYEAGGSYSIDWNNVWTGYKYFSLKIGENKPFELIKSANWDRNSKKLSDGYVGSYSYLGQPKAYTVWPKYSIWEKGTQILETKDVTNLTDSLFMELFNYNQDIIENGGNPKIIIRASDDIYHKDYACKTDGFQDFQYYFVAVKFRSITKLLIQELNDLTN